MATPGTSLSPDELDRLEDALERWTEGSFEPGPEDSLLAAPLRERLDGYREVLGHARAALPIEDVDDDVLAAVLAEARRGESKSRREAARPSLWERLRRSMLLPGVALAGSAALLLYVVQPEPELSLNAPASEDAPTKREEARLAPEAGPAPAAPSPAEAQESPSAAGAGADKLGGGEIAADPAEAVAPGAPVSKTSDAKAERPKAKSARKDDALAEEKEDLPGLGDMPTTDADKEELRDTLEKADKALGRSDCKAAMDGYMAAMKMDGAPVERAQARAGYAICLQQQGNDATADKYFSKARELWPGIDSWVSRMGVEGKKPSKSKAPPAKPKMPMVEPFK